MTPAQLLNSVGWIWAAFGVYWIAAALKSRSEKTRESRFYRIFRLCLLVIIFALLFEMRFRLGPLDRRFLPAHTPVGYLGFVVALAGMALAIWARIHLGQFWSDKVVLKVDHQLVRSGPYAHMRHPIYSGVLLGVAGTVLVLGEWRGVLAFVILLANYAVKARREDQVLEAAFEDAFQEHRTRAGFLLPRLRAK
jgi:protein-S-isoprenylcysteine O-methyltransferase Ste14